MKSSFLLTLMLALVFSLQAQLPNGSIAPDFTATDINGVSHHLYELLDSGKTVIMDVSATWCPPCWSYHQSNALENLWEQYGPNGTNEVYVLFIEGDPSTDMACLMGDVAHCPNTRGNWIEGTPYPIIDNANIAEAYAISYFPTIYTICPDRRVSEAGQLPTGGLYNFVQNCAAASGVNNAAVFDLQTGLISPYTCGTTVLQPTISFQNLGSANMTAVDFTFNINGSAVQTKTWTGDLATFGIAALQFDPYSINSDDFLDILITMDAVNGVPDESPDNNEQIVTLVPNPYTVETNQIKLELRTDNHGEETRWEFRDGQGNVLYSGGNPMAQPGAQNPDLTGGYAPNLSIRDTFFLPGPDCYQFYIVDDAGDGLTGSGYYKLTYLDGSTILENDGSLTTEHGDWVKAENIPVGAKSQTVEGHNLVYVFPNPAQDIVRIDWENFDLSLKTVSVRDALGKVVQQLPVSGERGRATINTAALPSGSYSVMIGSDSGWVVRRMVVLR